MTAPAPLDFPRQAFDIGQAGVIPLPVTRPPEQKITVLGLDCGQAQDYSAVAVCDYDVRLLRPADPLSGRREWQHPTFETHYLCKGVTRLDLGTSYVKVAEYVCNLARKLHNRDSEVALHLVLDCTGVGAGVRDLLNDRIPDYVMVSAVTLTGGDASKGDPSVLYRRESKVSKSYLVSRLQAALQAGRVHLPRSKEMDAMVEELLKFELRTRERTGTVESGVFATGKHDDGASTVEDRALPRLVLHGQAHGGHEVVVAADLEGAIALVGILAHANLIVEKLARQSLGLGRAGQQDAPGLQQHLQPANQERLV